LTIFLRVARTALVMAPYGRAPCFTPRRCRCRTRGPSIIRGFRHAMKEEIYCHYKISSLVRSDIEQCWSSMGKYCVLCKKRTVCLFCFILLPASRAFCALSLFVCAECNSSPGASFCIWMQDLYSSAAGNAHVSQKHQQVRI
jgi:hypothetical protein